MNQRDTLALRGTLNTVTRQIAENNSEKGWYDDKIEFLSNMALLHSEVSEAVDVWRVYGTADATKHFVPGSVGSLDAAYSPPKPEGVGSEFADIFIRLLDNCYLFEIDLAAEVQRKMNYNATRPHRHGGKRA